MDLQGLEKFLIAESKIDKKFIIDFFGVLQISLVNILGIQLLFLSLSLSTSSMSEYKTTYDCNAFFLLLI